MRELPKLKPSPVLANLLLACEKMCRHECCGIDAFNFSPLHVAAQMVAFKGSISEHDVEAMLGEVDQCLGVALGYQTNDQGYICTIEGTNENFNSEGLASLVRTLAASIRLAPQVVAYCDGMLARELAENSGRISSSRRTRSAFLPGLV